MCSSDLFKKIGRISFFGLPSSGTASNKPHTERQRRFGSRKPASPDPLWGYSSAGRALAWHARGQRFDPAYLHHIFKGLTEVQKVLTPSSRGLGHHPFTVSTGVRIPVGSPAYRKIMRHKSSTVCLLRQANDWLERANVGYQEW